ncbi:MAG: beta strand repeat-containing protein, partial [Planctomycetaceae bacterium]
ASGGNGSISLYAGNNITMGASGSITAAGSGAILLRASTNHAGGTAANGYNSPLAEASSNGIVSMNTSASITSATGDITIRGDGDISISTITSTSGNVTISADDDGVTTMSDGGGAIIDVLSTEAANITSGGTSLLTLSSGSGIGVSDDIDTTVVNLTASTRTTTGSGNIVIQETSGLVIAAGGVSTGAANGSIDIRTDAGSFTISGAISAHGTGNVTLLSTNGLMTVNAAVSSGSGNLSLTGGTGVTHNAAGDLTTTSTGTISVAATTGDVSMADGTVYSTGSGTVTVTAATNVQIGAITTTSSAIGVTATAGTITDNLTSAESANLTSSGTATLTAALGIGSSGTGDIDTNIGTLDASVTGTGSLFLQEADAIILLDVDTVSGAITISAGGTITATDVVSTGDLDANDISLTATTGNIVVGVVAAGTTAADVLLSAAAGNIEESGTTDIDADIVGQSIELIASTGIGNSAQIEVNGVLIAAVTATGDITIQDTTGGLEVNTLDVNGDTSSTPGVRITGGSASDTITIRTSSPLTITSAVSNVGGGDIILAAEGTATADNLAINAAVSASGGNGSISLYAGNNITMGASGSITAAGSGAILLRASTNYAGGTAANGYNSPLSEASSNGIVSMNTSASITSATGDITIRGDGDISISTITSTSGNITISADDNGVTTMSDGGGAIIDALSGEAAANITSGGTSLLKLSAGSGIGGAGVADINTQLIQLEATNTVSGVIAVTEISSGTPDLGLLTISNGNRGVILTAVSGALTDANGAALNITAGDLTLIAATGIGGADALETQITTLTADNTATGNIEINEVAGSDLTLLRVRQTNAAGSGNIIISTTDALLRVSATGFGVHSAGTGNIQLTAAGAVSDAAIFSNVSSNSGNISITAGRDILLGEGSSLAGGSGTRGVAISAAGPAAVLAAGGAAAGNTVLSVRSAGGFVAGQEMQLVDGLVSERAVVASVDLAARTITLTSPLLGSYSSSAQVLTRRAAATLTSDAVATTTTLAVSDTALFAAGTRIDIEVGGTIQTGVVATVDSGAGTISLTQPLTFAATSGARIFAARDQTIALSANRNLLAADGTLLTTDNLRSGSYSDLRGDTIAVVVDADNNASREDRNGDTNLTIADYIGAGGIQDGVLLLGADSRLRTDGGVASGFANRPVISDTLVATNTAFFTDFADPRIAAIGAVGPGLQYGVSFSLVLPSPGEENVRVDIDWRDPNVGPSGPRIDSQYLNFSDGVSSSLVRHGYHLNDFVNFFIIEKNPLFLDFAVSHHETISLTADAGVQGTRSALPWVSGSGLTEVSLTGNLSTTDNRGTTVAGPFPIEPAGVDRTLPWVADDTLSQTDYLFEGGIIRLNLPAPPFMREEEPSPFVSGELEPLQMREVFLRQLTQPENRLDEDLPLEQPSSVSEDIYQLRKRGDSGEYQVEKEDIESGERLLHPQLLRKWVADEDVSTGTGYELWLITRKKTASGGEIVVERQLLQFDVRDQRPFPSAEDAESLAPAELRLEPAEPAAQPGANPPAANGAALDQPAAAGAVAEPLNAAVESNSSADESSDAEEPQQPAPLATSAIAGLVVSQALRNRISQTASTAALKVARSLRNHRRV